MTPNITALPGFALVFMAFFFVGIAFSPANAGETTVTPALQFSQKYDDNIGFTREKKSDFVTLLTPEVNFSNKTEKADIRALGVWTISRHASETNRDSVNQKYGFQALYNPAWRWHLIGDLQYSRISTRETLYDSQIGFEYVDSTRETYRAMGKASYAIKERTELALTGLYRQVNFSFPGNIDYDSYSVFGAYTYTLADTRNIFSIQPSYSRYDSADSSTDNYALYFGWTHKFSQVYELQAALGVRHADIRYLFIMRELVFANPWSVSPIRIIEHRSTHSTSNTGMVADIYFRKKGEDFSWLAGLYRRLGYNSYGEPAETTAIYANAQKDISQRLKALFSTNYYTIDSIGPSNRQDSSRLDISPSVAWKISQNSYLLFVYRFSLHNEDAPIWQGSYDRHQAWITFNIGFPQKW